MQRDVAHDTLIYHILQFHWCVLGDRAAVARHGCRKRATLGGLDQLVNKFNAYMLACYCACVALSRLLIIDVEAERRLKGGLEVKPPGI